MKILLAGSVVDYSVFDVGVGYYEALQDAGHEVKLFAINRRLAFWGLALTEWANKTGQGLEGKNGDKKPDPQQVLREAANQILIEAAYFQPELVVVISGMGFHPDAVFHLESHGYPTASIFTESPYDDDKQELFAQLSTYIFSNERSSVERFKAFNPNAQYLPTAFNARRHRPDIEPLGDAQVLFVGTGFGERVEIMNSVDWRDINFEIYGYWGGFQDDGSPENWGEDDQLSAALPPKLKPYFKNPEGEDGIPNDEAIRRYRGADICLNFYREIKEHDKGLVTSMNPRAYELAAVGAFQLAQDVPSEAHEILGDSIAYFNTPQELEAQIAYYLARPEQRQRMANEAQRRIQGHHYLTRVKTLTEAVTAAPEHHPVGMVRGTKIQAGHTQQVPTDVE